MGRRTAGWVALGFVVLAGIGLGALSLNRSSNSPPKPPDLQPVREVLSPEPEPEAGPENPPAGGIRVEPRDVDVEKELLRARLRQYEGDEAVWPEDTPPEFRQSAIEALAEALAASSEDLVFVDTDCYEYPCIMLLDVPDRDGLVHAGRVSAMVSHLSEELGATEPYASGHFSLSAIDLEGSVIVTVAAAEEALEAGVQQRLEYRLDGLRKQYQTP